MQTLREKSQPGTATDSRRRLAAPHPRRPSPLKIVAVALAIALGVCAALLEDHFKNPGARRAARRAPVRIEAERREAASEPDEFEADADAVPPPASGVYRNAAKAQELLENAEDQLERSEFDLADRNLASIEILTEVPPHLMRRARDMRASARDMTEAWTTLIANVKQVSEDMQQMNRFYQKNDRPPIEGVLVGEDAIDYQIHVQGLLVGLPKEQVAKIEPIKDRAARDAALRARLSALGPELESKVSVRTMQDVPGLLDALRAREAWRLTLEEDAQHYFKSAWDAGGSRIRKALREMDGRDRLAQAMWLENIGRLVEAKQEYRRIIRVFSDTRVANDARKALEHLEPRVAQGKEGFESWKVVDTPNGRRDPSDAQRLVPRSTRRQVRLNFPQVGDGDRMSRAHQHYMDGLNLLKDSQNPDARQRNRSLSKAERHFRDARSLYEAEQKAGNKSPSIENRIVNINRYIFQCMKIRGL